MASTRLCIQFKKKYYNPSQTRQVLDSDDVATEDRSASSPAAVGVEYMLDGRLETTRIAAAGSHGREGSAVVVTAGALHTPKVREREGF